MESFESNTGRVEHFRTKIVNCVDHRGFGALECAYACLLLTRGAPLEGAT